MTLVSYFLSTLGNRFWCAVNDVYKIAYLMDAIKPHIVPAVTMISIVNSIIVHSLFKFYRNPRCTLDDFSSCTILIRRCTIITFDAVQTPLSKRTCV